MNEEIKVSLVDKSRKFWYMRYIDPLTGVQHTRSTKETKRDLALKAATRWEDELRKGRPAEATRMSWEDFKDLYDDRLQTKSAGMAAATYAAFNHVDRTIRPRRLSDMTTTRIRKLSQMLRSEGMKPTTLATHLRHLRAALRWAVKQELLAVAPKFDMPEGVNNDMRSRAITTEEFERILTAVAKVRKWDVGKWQRFLRGLWLSGLRISEALTLSWDRDAPIHVDMSGKHPIIRLWASAHKSRRDTRLPTMPDFAEMLRSVPESEREGSVFNISMGLKPAVRVVSAIGKTAGVVTNKTEAKFASAHDFRRGFATRWAKRGVAPLELQKLMRHKDIATTLAYYADLDADGLAADLAARFANVPLCVTLGENEAKATKETAGV